MTPEALQERFLENNLIVEVKDNGSVGIMPPLVINKEQVGVLLSHIQKTIGSL